MTRLLQYMLLPAGFESNVLYKLHNYKISDTRITSLAVKKSSMSLLLKCIL